MSVFTVSAAVTVKSVGLTNDEPHMDAPNRYSMKLWYRHESGKVTTLTLPITEEQSRHYGGLVGRPVALTIGSAS